MRELVEYLAKALVDSPEAVTVSQREEEDTIVIELMVLSQDMGKVIGKQGRIAKAIRTLVKASAGQNEKRKIAVDIVPQEEE